MGGGSTASPASIAAPGFSVNDADTLRASRREPERYRNLIVRVVVYSDYCADVGSELQDEIISRTEFEEVG